MHGYKHVLEYLKFYYRDAQNPIESVNNALNYLFTPDNENDALDQLDEELELNLLTKYKKQIVKGIFDEMLSADSCIKFVPVLIRMQLEISEFNENNDDHYKTYKVIPLHSHQRIHMRLIDITLSYALN